MSPEQAVTGIYSRKSDIFSFGVIVLEIVSGKQNRTFSSSTNLPSHVSYSYFFFDIDNQKLNKS